MDQHEHIDIEEFDREYGLKDLLPISLVQDLLGEISRLIPMAIMLPDGSVYCDFSESEQAVPWSDEPSGRTENIHPVLPQIRKSDKSFPLRHELEDIGYLVIRENRAPIQGNAPALGQFIATAVNHIIRMMYKTRMTAGLHVRVVEESFQELKEKNARLQQSEEKYRKLSRNLEIEVQRKTEKIKATQLVMLQQEKLASIGQLAAGMAHEINNPIGFIISNLNTLATNIEDTLGLLRHYQRLNSFCSDDNGCMRSGETIRQELMILDHLSRKLDIDFVADDTKALIKESLDGAGRISTIVQSLRDFAHPGVEALETADINHCLDTTLSILEGLVLPGITIDKQYANIPKVSCRLRELNQVFFHVLRNALQAVGDKGEITIITRSTGDEAVEVIISDSGAGIAEPDLPHIFEPFFTTRQVGSGTGLGLHLAHNIIKNYGGRIEVKSRQTAGSTFGIQIPVNGPRRLSESHVEQIS